MTKTFTKIEQNKFYCKQFLQNIDPCTKCVPQLHVMNLGHKVKWNELIKCPANKAITS